MSADSIHGSLEQALRRKGEVFDFNDLVSVYSGARCNLSVITIAPENFLSWTPQRRSSTSKTLDPLPTLASCVELAVKRILTVFSGKRRSTLQHFPPNF